MLPKTLITALEKDVCSLIKVKCMYILIHDKQPSYFRSWVLKASVGRVVTDTIGRQVDRHSVDSRLTSRSIVGRLPVAMLFMSVDRRSPQSVDTCSVCWSKLGRHLDRYIAINSRQCIECRWCIGRLSVVCVVLEW